VKSKPLGPIIAPVGSVQCCVHGAYLKPSLSQVQRRARATMSIQSSKGLYAALPLSVCRTPPHHCPAFRTNWRTIARKRSGHKSGNDRFAPIAVVPTRTRMTPSRHPVR
jgi:hypothetical protein